MTRLVGFGLVALMGQAPAAPVGAISGIVVEQGARTPVSGAQVTAMLERRGPPGPDVFANRPPTVLTDAAGRFSFSGLAPGRYRLTVSKAGYAMSFGPTTPPQVVDLTDRVDSVELALPRGGVIVGRVLDANGEPIADASVSPMRRIARGRLTRPGAPPVDTERQPQLVMAGPSVQANELGEFRIHSLAAGEYYVRAMPRMMAPAIMTGAGTSLVPTFLPSTTDPTAAQAVLVVAGETSAVGDLRLVAAAAFTVSGVVVDHAGKPAAGVMVRLTSRDAPFDGRPMMGPAGQTRTAADGTFRLDAVTEGAYTLIAVPPTVIARAPASAGGGSSGFTSFSGGVGGTGGMVMTETRDGVTVQYQDDAGTQLPVTVSGQSVPGLQVQLRAPR